MKNKSLVSICYSLFCRMTRRSKKAQIGLFMVLAGFCILLTLYFTWEVMYQEPAIVKILTFAKIRQESQKQVTSY